jgi:probable HAF family extracellular repeat protein
LTDRGIVGDRFSQWIAILWLSAGILGPALVAQRATYSIIDLGTLGGATSEASGVNNLGEVVGSSTTAGGASHPFLYRSGRMLDLGTLPGGTASYGTAINNRGDVAGYGGINGYGPPFQEFTQGFVWQDGSMRTLGAFYCPCSFNRRYGTSKALAVSSGGQIVGDSETSQGESFRHALLWVGSNMRDLTPELDRFQSSYAYGINDANQIVGAANGRAFLVGDGVIQDLGVLSGDTTSSARAVNNVGQVVGSSVNAAGISHAFLWDLGTMRSLGTLPGDVSSEARAINILGQAVGRSGSADLSTSRAVLWRDGAAVDLNSLVPGSGWLLSSATGINDVRQIVGVGVRDGQVRAFLLNPL